MNLNNNQTTIRFSTSTSCLLKPRQESWEVGGSAFHVIVGLMTVMASFPTIILNAFIILAIKQKRELQKPSNIMLSSLAVTDLLVGVVLMPTTATIDFFTLRQVSTDYTCMLHLAIFLFTPLLFSATLHHLTVIAWERYVAVQKWMDYKRIISNGRLRKIAIGTWLSALFVTAAYVSIGMALENRKFSNIILTMGLTVETVCLFLIAFFYRKVYLGIRNRKLNDISQIDVLVKARLDFKVAKTTGLLTAAVISSFIPIFLFSILGNVVPLLRTNAAKRFIRIVTQLNSLFNPLLYCYRDDRFRKAVRELLRMKKPHESQSTVGATQFIRRNDPFTSSEVHIGGKRAQRLTRSVSSNLTDALYSIYGKPGVFLLKTESLSAPTLYTAAP